MSVAEIPFDKLTPPVKRIKMSDVNPEVLAKLTDDKKNKLRGLLGAEARGLHLSTKLKMSAGHGSNDLASAAHVSLVEDIAQILGPAEFQRLFADQGVKHER